MVKLDRKWALAACAMVLVIWGNSLVPGTGSGSLSLSIMESIDLEGRRTFDVLLPTAVFLLLVPSIDETIQLFVPGRAGMITDVMIDCCGATTGVVLRYLLRSLMHAKKAA